MFRHLFKLIWNKKKQNFLLISEMLISFLVLFAVFTLVVYFYQNYRKPMGFEYENVWVANFNNSLTTDNDDSLALFYETLRQTLKSMPEIKGISFASSNTPFSGSTIQNGIKYNNKEIDHTNWFEVDDSYKDVLNVRVLDGRWFNKEDAVAKDHPIIINASLKDLLFGNGTAIGKMLGDDKDKQKVIGVIEDMKVNGDYQNAERATYNRIGTGSLRGLGRILIKVIPDAGASFEGRLYKTMANSLKNANVEIEHLSNKRKNTNSFAVIPTILLLIVSCFLMINVALGLLGVLWYNINKRRGEIGLRRAVGATGRSVSAQLVGEALILATLSLIIGSFFAIQFPLLNIFDLPPSAYIIANVLAIVFIYVLVLVCSLYPGRQAAAIYPAVALHEE